MATGQLTAAERQRIVAAVQEVLASERGVSMTTLGKIIGASRATVSRVLRGTYTGTADRFLNLLSAWLANRSERADIPQTPYVPTAIGRQIVAACLMAYDKPAIALIKTSTGCGKTAALLEVARRLGENSAVYLSAGEAVSSPRELLIELSRLLGVRHAARATVGGMYRSVRDALAARYQLGKGERVLILVDEATTLRGNAINMLRNLRDDPACSPGLVLADTVSRLDGFLYARGNIAGGTEQLRRRACVEFCWCYRGDDESGERIDAADVKAVAESTLAALGVSDKRARLDGRALKLLTELANDSRREGFAAVVDRIENLYYYATRAELAPEFTVAQLDYMASMEDRRPAADYSSPPFRRAVA